ncbi:MAG: winged helix-turn-helix domain-containing protein [Alphaproteobacteria bacterium]|nr:winged helix-turn-helix domain-containing protein [Alphaproteobacteria bacterium]MBV8337421.1 winged helix-turn-helix domain-containing protein [Alphaproteobacteria bacterium]
MVFRFGDHVLDIERRELRRGTELIPVEPQVFDLLVYLLRNRGRVVSKDDLIDSVWGGRVVSDSALTTRLNAARKSVNDSGATQRVIRTLARKGVRFVAEVTEDGTLETGAAASEPSLALTRKPSIAVLPFANLSGDTEQEYFADGMVDEIITALSRIRWLFVIARNSSFTYKGQVVDVKRVGRELGVRYVLEGSLRKAGGRLRITAQLIDATNGAHLWADRFEGSLEDVFELQDNVAASVAGVIEPALQAAEAARSAARPTTDLGAYDSYLRALIVFHPMTRAAVGEALGLLEQAISIDHDYGPALAFAAACHMQFVNYSWAADAAAARDNAVDLARRALQASGDDPGVIASAAKVLAVFGEDIDTMMALVDHALTLNPSSAIGWYHSGFLRMMAGKPDRAIELAEVSLRLSPRARIGAVHTVIGASHFLSRRFDEARAKLLLAMEETPNFPVPYRYLAACYAHMGRLDQGRDVITRLRSITPAVIPPRIVYLRHAEHRALYLSGLRLATDEAS